MSDHRLAVELVEMRMHSFVADLVHTSELGFDPGPAAGSGAQPSIVAAAAVVQHQAQLGFVHNLPSFASRSVHRMNLQASAQQRRYDQQNIQMGFAGSGSTLGDNRAEVTTQGEEWNLSHHL